MAIIKQDYGSLADMATQQLIAPIFPTLVATKAVSKDGLFIINNTLYKATADIAQDAQIVVGTNAELASTVAEELMEHDRWKQETGTTLASLNTLISGLSEKQKNALVLTVTSTSSTIGTATNAVYRRMFASQYGIFNMGNSTIYMYFITVGSTPKSYSRAYNMAIGTTQGSSKTEESTITSWSALYPENI